MISPFLVLPQFYFSPMTLSFPYSLSPTIPIISHYSVLPIVHLSSHNTLVFPQFPYHSHHPLSSHSPSVVETMLCFAHNSISFPWSPNAPFLPFFVGCLVIPTILCASHSSPFAAMMPGHSRNSLSLPQCHFYGGIPTIRHSSNNP